MRTPEETVERIRAGFRRLGLELTYTANATTPTRWFGASIPAPVLGTYSGHAHVRGMPPHFGTNGKGMSHKLAMASAFGELCERYSIGVLHSYYSAYARDRGLVSDEIHDHLANVRFLPGYVEGHRDQIADRLELDAALRAGGMRPEDVARLFALPIARNWVDGASLTDGRTYKVPLTLLTTLTGSNGMAAGNTPAEAITHALGGRKTRKVDRRWRRRRATGCRATDQRHSRGDDQACVSKGAEADCVAEAHVAFGCFQEVGHARSRSGCRDGRLATSPALAQSRSHHPARKKDARQGRQSGIKEEAAVGPAGRRYSAGDQRADPYGRWCGIHRGASPWAGLGAFKPDSDGVKGNPAMGSMPGAGAAGGDTGREPIIAAIPTHPKAVTAPAANTIRGNSHPCLVSIRLPIPRPA